MSASAPVRTVIPYRIRTPRMLLRCYELTDVPARVAAMRAEHLLRFFGPPPENLDPTERELARVRSFRGSFDLDQNWMYLAEDPSTGQLLGELCLLTRAGIAAREIGYWISEAALKKGYATEGTSALARVAFELHHVKRVDLMISPENEASAAVARRLNFTLEGRLRDRQLASHHPRGDLYSFTLLDSEFASSPAAAVKVEAWDALGRKVL